MTALMAASIGLVQSDIKRVIAYSTCSQLGYMVLACGLSNYSASLFHLMNHAFFVRWYRYFDLFDVLSFRNTLKGYKLTYLYSKFEGYESFLRNSFIIIFYFVEIIIGIWDKYGEWKRTFVKNCVIVIRLNNFYVKLFQKINNNNTHIISYRSIESTLNLSIKLKIWFINLIKNNLIIVKILKISKPVIFFDLLQFFILIFFQANSSYSYAQSGCRIDYQAKALSNVKDRLKLTKSWDCRINHSCYKKYNRNYSTNIRYKEDKNISQILIIKNQIIKEVSSYFNINYSKEKIFKELNYIIPHWIILLGNTNKGIHWLRNIIYGNFYKWAIKKFKGSHNKIYEEHLSKFNLFYKFNTLPFNIPLTKKYPVFNNIKNEKLNINSYLDSLNIKSGIYIFYLTNKPLHFYIGLSLDLKKRFQTHLTQPFNELTKKKHPKFYSYVRKYKWESFSFMIITTCSPEYLVKQECIFLNKIFNSSILKANTLNILTGVSG
jgi:hypothetical protein